MQALDGAPTSNLYGSDLKPEFMDLGYDLFLDKSSLQAHFITADIFASTSPLDELDSTVDMIQASSFFHLFSREQQLLAGAKCMKLLKHTPGSMIFGRQMGRPADAGAGHSKTRSNAYWHNEESFEELWIEIADKAGVKVNVVVEFENVDFVNSRGALMQEGSRRLKYATRLQ